MAAYLTERKTKTGTRSSPAGILATPVPKAKMGQDAETAAHRFGDFVPTPALEQVAEAKSIRTVGPAYYYQPTDSVEGLYRKPVPSHRFTLSLVGPAQADSTER